MFNLDVRVFNYVYNNCRQMGSVFGFGAFEGFIMYSSLVSLGIIRFLDAKKVKK